MISAGIERVAVEASDIDKVHRYEDWFPTSDTIGARQTTNSGANVNAQTALTLSSYFACVRNISDDLGKIPLITYKRLQPRGRERATEHSNYELLRIEPNNEMGSLTFIQTLTAWALGWGAGYANIERNGAGRPVALWPVHPSRVEVKRDDAGDIVYDVRSDDIAPGSIVRIPARDMIHVHGLGEQGITGYAISTLARESIGLGLATQDYAASFFKNDATPLTVIMYPPKMGKDAIKKFRQKWTEQVSGENRHKPALMVEGMKIQQLSISPGDAQLIESGNYNVGDMARWFRVPQHKIGLLINATFSNITEQNLEYVIDCLDSWATIWQQEILRKMFTVAERSEYFVEFLFAKLLRGDPVKRSQVYRTQWSVGALSSNDIRDLENMNPIDGGDEYFIPMNVKPITEPASEPTGNGTGFENEEPSNTEENRNDVVDAIEGIVKVETRALARSGDHQVRNHRMLESKRHWFVDAVSLAINASPDDYVLIDDYSVTRMESKLRGLTKNVNIDCRAMAEDEADALIKKLKEARDERSS
jgi:HK97 family phage portal protein